MNASYNFMSAPPVKQVGKVKTNNQKKENILIGILATLSIFFIILIVGLLIYRTQMAYKAPIDPTSYAISYPISSPISYIANVPSYLQQMNGLLANNNLTGSAKWIVTDIKNSESYEYKDVRCNDGTTMSADNSYQTLELSNATTAQLDSEASRIHLGLNIAGWKQCNSILFESATREVWLKDGLLLSIKITKANADSSTLGSMEGVFEFRK